MSTLIQIIDGLATKATPVSADYFLARDSAGGLKRVLFSSFGTTLQPLNTNLTAIAALPATAGNFIQSVAGVWAARTTAQTVTALAAAGLVDSTSAQAAIGGAKTFTSIVAFSNAASVAGAFTATDKVTVTKALILTPAALTPTTGTASLDASTANNFTVSPTGALTINATGIAAGAGQTVKLVVTARAVADVITFGTNFKSSGTLTLAGTAGKQVVFTFYSDGVSLIEERRTLEL